MPQPVRVGLPLKPNPGSDGHTTWNASDADPPWATGSVSGPMTFRNSSTEPGQPCVMTSGTAPASGDRAWMKCTSMPPTRATNWSNRLRARSRSRQSYSLSQ